MRIPNRTSIFLPNILQNDTGCCIFGPSYLWAMSDMFCDLYKTIVRPHLKYATTVCTPLFKKDMIAIENFIRQSACLVFNPIMVDNYAAFFNCTLVGRASDSMMAPT